MHDEQIREQIASTISAAAPAEVADDQVASVVSRGHDRARARRRARPPAWSAAAAAVLVLVAAVAFGALGARENTEAAIAKEAAFAALHPKPGMVIRAKTRTWAQNDGDAEPIIDGSTYDEYWIDFDGERDRYESHLTSTDETLAVAVGDGARYRYLGDDLDTPEQDLVVNEAYASGEMGSGALWPYYYLRTMLPSGKAVGEAEHNGETYWEIRWDDARDTAGNRLDARALIDKVDYHPALIERHYPGGAREVWEVLEWEVLAEADLPRGFLDVASLSRSGVPHQSSWRAEDLAEKTDLSVYWAEKEFGKAIISGEYSENGSGVQITPLFVIRDDYAAAVATRVLGDHVVAWYGDDTGTLQATIASGPAMGRDDLAEAMTALAKSGTEIGSRESAIGETLVVELVEGDVLAAVSAPDATVVVQAVDSKTLDQALVALRRLEVR